MLNSHVPSSVLLLARELGLGGSERQLCELAKALDGDRLTAHVGAFYRQGVRLPELVAASIPVTEFPLRSFLSPLNLIEVILALRRYVRTHGIRLVHSFDPPSSLLLGLASPFLRPAVVLTSQRSYRSVRTPMFHRLLRFSDKRVDGVVVNCNAIQRHLAEDEGVPISRIHVCYNGIEAGRFQRRAELRPPSLPAGSLVIGTICVLRREKGLFTLLEAFSRCRNLHPQLKLVIVGDGPLGEDLYKARQEMGLEDCCIFQPAVADVLPWLSSMDIFVLASTFEALSNALMEAMAAGCACVASRVGGNPELIEHGTTGLLFETGDPASLETHLRALIAGHDLRQRLATAAKLSIRSRFPLEASTNRFLDLYERMINPAVAR